MESNEKVEVNVENLKKAMNELIKDQRYELVTDIATEVINNPNTSNEARATMQGILIKLDILAKDYDIGKSRALGTLENEKLEAELRQKMMIKLITVEIADENYDEAEKIAYKVLSEKGLRKEDEVKLQSQLISILIAKKNYKFATYRAIQLLKRDGISNKTRNMTKSRLARINVMQEKYKEARKILKLSDVSEIIRYVEELEPDARELVLWEEELKKNEKTEDIKSDISEEVEEPEIKQEVKYEQEEFISTVQISDKRKAIYKGEIDIEQINSLAEDNKDTLEGCLFLAELCAYFNLQHLGSNCLKAYRKNNSNLEEDETKLISKALELLKRNGLNEQRLKEEWTKIYAGLPKVEQKQEQEHKEARIFIEEHENCDGEIEPL